MSSSDQPHEPPSPDEGERAASSGTPVPVDLSGDRGSRVAWVLLLAGPVIWFAHFMVVYLIAEAGCTGDGALLDRFDPPTPVVATWIATAVAVPAGIAAAVWAWRSWRASGQDDDLATDAAGPTAGLGPLRTSSLAFIGVVLSVGSVGAILFTAAPALVLSCTG